MAKKRKLSHPDAPETAVSTAPSVSRDSPGLNPWAIALGLLSGAVVYVLYHPSDSVEVEKGAALWFTLLAISIATLVFAFRPAAAHGYSGTATQQVNEIASRLLDWLPWVLAVWMMLAAFASSPPGNLRMATNEGWLWLSAAAIFSSARRLMSAAAARRNLLLLLTAAASGLAVHALHQQFVSLPQTRAEYLEDPDRMLAEAGFDAPPGSTERMVFENRLFDGGPTATFALANSLAAVLLVGVLIPITVLVLRWTTLTVATRSGWITALGLTATALLATRSRAGVLALFVGVLLVVVIRSGFGRNRGRTLAQLAAIAVVGGLLAAALWLFGHPEWYEAAWASFAVRFEYWRATLAMVWGRPWFAAGPGNFQSIYNRYRPPSATEQIAEPHNFFFETLASGGWIAGGLLAALLVAGVVVARGRRLAASERASAELVSKESDSGTGKWFWLGAVLSLVLVWVFGFATRSLPDWQAHRIAVPLAVGIAGWLSWTSTRLSPRDVDNLFAVIVISLAIHLSVSGGWTVPGVAISVWVFAGAITRRRQAWLPQEGGRSVGGNEPHRRTETVTTWRVRWAAVAAGTLAVAGLYLFSLRPVERQRQAMAESVYAQSLGQLGRFRASLDRAATADPWSAEGVLWLSDATRWQLILSGDSPELRRQWREAVAEAKRRAGDDPAVYRILAQQQLHLYQRYGRDEDLSAAASTIDEASRWSPSSEWLAAQRAAIAAAQGRDPEARRWASRAWQLSQLGNNIERSLERQQIYEPSQLGVAAERGPIRRPASELLANQLPPGDV